MGTASNVISVLTLFSFSRPEWTVDEAAQELRLGRSTTYRYFRVLSEAGLIIAYRAGCYILGPAITQLDRQTRLLDPLITAARTQLPTMTSMLSRPSVVLVCRLYRDQVMCIYQEAAGALGLPVSYERGKLMALHRGAASKVILAHLPARFVKAYCLRHGAEMAMVGLGSDWQNVRVALRTLRNTGFAVTRGELDAGLIGIAAPFFDADGNVIGSLGAVMKDNLTDGDVDTSCEIVKTFAQSIDAEFVTRLLE